MFTTCNKKKLKSFIFIGLCFFSIHTINAQFIAVKGTKKNDFELAEKKFKVVIDKEKSNPLLINIKVINPTKEPINAYLRMKNESNFLEAKRYNDYSVLTMTLNLSTLNDGTYVIVIKNDNGFFIRNILLESGDLNSDKSGILISRIVTLSEE